MDKNFLQTMENRRTHYLLNSECGIEEGQIIDMIDRVMLTTPSAFNGQTTRIALLMGRHHYRLWEIVKHTLSELLSPEATAKTNEKIDRSFLAGCGTVLFFEDMEIVELQKREFPTYAEAMATYSEQTSAMHQFAIWCLLEDMGFGASLQHYNPLIDSRVAEEWALPSSWRLRAQMPFGNPLSTPAPREQHIPIAERRLIFTK
ncbi:MAG: nitroreductase family protein [Tidjanibacter sp.]|nr:nitroreductase family protein [Tidjanibacter sp.]